MSKTTLALLEVHERGMHHMQCVRITQWPCVIGRALHADVVLSDPSVGAEHLRLEAAASGPVQAQVLDALNGVWQGRKQYSQGQSLSWGGGQVLRLGRSSLRLRLASDALPPQQPWRPSSGWEWLLTLAAVLMLFAVMLVDQWLSASSQQHWQRSVPMEVLGGLMALLFWTLPWSFIGKIWTGAAAFVTHLRIASLAGLGVSCCLMLTHVLAFSFSLPWLGQFDSAWIFMGMALAGWHHLRVASSLSRRVVTAIALGLMVLAIAWMLGERWQTRQRLTEHLFMQELYQPGWRWAQPVDMESYLQRLPELQAPLEAKRLQLEAQADADTPDDAD